MFQEIKQMHLFHLKGTAYIHISLIHCNFLFHLFLVLDP